MQSAPGSDIPFYCLFINQNEERFSDRTVVVDQDSKALSLSGTSTKSMDSDASAPAAGTTTAPPLGGMVVTTMAKLPG